MLYTIRVYLHLFYLLIRFNLVLKYIEKKSFFYKKNSNKMCKRDKCYSQQNSSGHCIRSVQDMNLRGCDKKNVAYF